MKKTYIIFLLILSILVIVLVVNNTEKGNKYKILEEENSKLEIENKRYSDECKYLKTEINRLKAELKGFANNVNKTISKTDFQFSICDFHLGMSQLEYKDLIKTYKKTEKMSIWDGNIYCMPWFQTPNTISVRETRLSNDTFQCNQAFYIIFDTQPQFKNDKLTLISFLIEPSFDNTNLYGADNKNILIEHISKIVGDKPINDTEWEKQTTKIVLKEQKIKSKYYDNIDTYYRITISQI